MAKPKPVKGLVLRAPVGVQARYAAKMRAAIGRMAKETEREIVALFNSPTAKASHVMTEDASIASQSRILMNAIQRKWEKVFTDLSRPWSEEFVAQTAAASRVDLRKSFAAMGAAAEITPTVLRGGPVGDIVKATVAENVGLIKSIPIEYLDGIRVKVTSAITTGNGLGDILPYLKNELGVADRRANNIALDQTRKTYNAINKGRMQNAGVESFEWIHTGGGQKPRPHHEEMSGNIYRFDDLPVIEPRTGERGIPGQAINCRCTMRPVLDFGGGEA